MRGQNLSGRASRRKKAPVHDLTMSRASPLVRCVFNVCGFDVCGGAGLCEENVRENTFYGERAGQVCRVSCREEEEVCKSRERRGS